MQAQRDWEHGFSLVFSQLSGLTGGAESTKRTLSQMRGMFRDAEAVSAILRGGDPLIYEFYELGAPETPGDLAFGTSICYPGKVGDEYFMTKGHFHTLLDCAEVYHTLSGQGLLLMENPEGDVQSQVLRPGAAVYVPPRYAHRSVNTGTTPLVTFFVFRADAGHDYATIEPKGFRKLALERDGQLVLRDNPLWA